MPIIFQVRRNMVENYAEIAKELEHVIKFQMTNDNTVDHIKLTNPHECIQCGYSTLRINLIQKHVKSGGPFHTNQCTQCIQTFKSFAEYDTHVKQFHMGNWKYKCGICEDIFDTKDEIRSHRMKKHGSSKTKVIKKSSR